MQRWAVICGVVRDEGRFIEKLDTLTRWKADCVIDGVVFSTWLGELNAYPAAAAALSRVGAIIVETDPPVIKTFGHTLHQSKTLWFGLQAVPENALVLKLRPDLGPLTAKIGEALQHIDLNIAADGGAPPVFRKRIAIHSFFPEAPYYCNDIIFFGQREDLLKLANFDITTEMLVTNSVAEQFFFRPPLGARYPLLDAYLQVHAPFMPGSDGRAEQRLDIMLASDFYLDMLAMHLRVVHRYFRVGILSERAREQEPGIPDGLTLRQFLRPEPGREDMLFLLAANACVFSGERPVEALLHGRFVSDEIGARMRTALYRTADPAYAVTYPANPLRPSEGARKLQAQLGAAFPDVLARIDQRQDPEGRSFLVRGNFDRIVALNADAETQALHSEINLLRRRLDEALGHRK